MSLTVKGYRRADGTVGIRNHVLVLPSVFCASKVCQDVAAGMAGVVTVEHQHGCGQIGADKEQTRRILVNFALNPNVYGVVVIGLGCEGAAAKLVAEEIQAQSAKPVRYITIQNSGGTPATIAAGRRLAQELVAEAGRQVKEDILLADLAIGIIPNQGEPNVAAAAAPVLRRVAERLIEEGATAVYGDPQELAAARTGVFTRCSNAGVRERLSQYLQIIDSLPKQDGCYADMISSTGRLAAVVGHAERLPAQAGLVWMEGPHHELEQLTGLAAAGVQLTLMGTGYGNVMSTPIVPVLTVAASHELFHDLAGDLDFDAGAVLSNPAEETAVAAALFSDVIEAINGKPVKSEELGIAEFAINRIGTSI